MTTFLVIFAIALIGALGYAAYSRWFRIPPPQTSLSAQPTRSRLASFSQSLSGYLHRGGENTDSKRKIGISIIGVIGILLIAVLILLTWGIFASIGWTTSFEPDSWVTKVVRLKIEEGHIDPGTLKYLPTHFVADQTMYGSKRFTYFAIKALITGTLWAFVVIVSLKFAKWIQQTIKSGSKNIDTSSADDPNASGRLIREIGPWAILYAVEQGQRGIEYSNIVGIGLGKVTGEVEEGYHIKFPGFWSVRIYSVKQTTTTIKAEDTDYVLCTIQRLSKEDQDFSSDSLTKDQEGAIRIPKVANRLQEVKLANAKVRMEWQLTYEIYDLSLFAARLDAKFQRNPIAFAESVISGLLASGLRPVFWDDTYAVPGDIVAAGLHWHVSGCATEDELYSLSATYKEPQGLAHWRFMRDTFLKDESGDETPFNRFNTTVSDAQFVTYARLMRLNSNGNMCVYVRLLDVGIRLISLVRQKTVSAPEVEQLLDAGTQAELMRRNRRTGLQQEIDETQATAVKRQIMSLTSASNLVTEINNVAKEMPDLPKTEIVKIVMQRQFLRVLERTPQGKYLLSNVAGFMPEMAMTVSALSNSLGVKEADVKKAVQAAATDAVKDDSKKRRS